MQHCKRGNNESDMFLDIFSQDFIKITKLINLKRKIRGKDDLIKNKLQKIEVEMKKLETKYS